MATSDGVQVTGEYRRLLGVPKRAVVDLLALDHYRSEVGHALGAIGHEDLAPTAADLASLPQAELVHVAQACPSITEEHAKALYEEYLYTGMKSLYLYELVAGAEAPGCLNDLERLGAVVEAMLEQAEHEDVRALQLRIQQSEALPSVEGTLLEASYSYIAYVRRTDPRTEYPESLPDLRRGFVWVDVDHRWAVVCARDEGIADFLALAVEEWARMRVRRLPVSKSVLRIVQPDETIRRMSLMDPGTKTRRRWTGSRLSGDELAMSEILRRRDGDEQSTSGYNEDLPDGSTFALGYTGSLGRMYFSRDLTVTHMRQWGPQKITELVAAIRQMRASEPDALARELVEQALPHVRKETRSAIGDIAAAMLACTSSGDSERDLPFDALEALERLRTYVDCSFVVHCPHCGQWSELQCSNCHSGDFVAEQRSVRCARCAEALDHDEVHCAEDYDHVLQVSNAADLMVLTPTSKLLDALTRVAATAGVPLHADRDFFTIHGATLHYLRSGGELLYTIDDIPELARLLAGPVPDTEVADIIAKLPDFDEACRHPTTEMCAACVQSRQGGPCYQRLFGLLDADYTPSPHSGSEFTDYSKLVTVGSNRCQMVVAMKPGRPSGRPVTLRSGLGRDIYTQVASYLADARMGLIGICLPQRLHAGFVATLLGLAAYHGKKLLIVNERDLARIVYSVMIRHKLSLDSI